MGNQAEAPFGTIESALEYVDHFLEAIHEGETQIEEEIGRATNLELARRKQALQLVSYKLAQLSTHITTSRRILNDLKILRRLLLEEKKPPETSSLRDS